MNKLITITLLTFILCGCAPHYYNFKQLSVEGSRGKDVVVNIENDYFHNIHFPGNRIVLSCILNISNKSDDVLLIEGNNFKISSKIYNYKFSHYSYVKKIDDSPEKQIVYSRKSIKISPDSKERIEVIFELDKKIKEKEFVSERLKDTITIMINVNEDVITYTYKPI